MSAKGSARHDAVVEAIVTVAEVSAKCFSEGAFFLIRASSKYVRRRAPTKCRHLQHNRQMKHSHVTFLLTNNKSTNITDNAKFSIFICSVRKDMSVRKEGHI